MNQKESNELLNKKRKRDEIIKNFNELEEIFKTERAQNIFNSLGIFSLEEYSKFFQNLSNKEYKSMNEYNKKSKEPILIDKSKLKFDYTSKISDIQLTIKDILKSNLQPKGISKKIKENMNKIIPKENNINFNSYLKSISENINNILNQRNELDINIFKQIIKIYSILIRTIDKIEFEQDKDFFNLLQKYLNNKSISDFIYLSLFWLNNEYLLCCEKKESQINKYKRYDIILDKIIIIIDKLLNDSFNYIINNDNYNDNFISNIPLYNKNFINFITKFQNIYISNKSEEINDILKINKTKNLFDVIPFLKNIKYIYINIINQKNLVEIKDKEEIRKILLENFLLLTRNKKYFNAKALEFIFNDIYNMSKYEQEVIKDFGNQGFDEIKTLKEEDKEKIEQRFFFYLFLCKKDNLNIIKLPSVYKEVNKSIKDMMNYYIEKRFKDLLKQNEQYLAEKLINECSENSEEIVIYVIKNIYGNPEYKCEKIIEDEKLYRNIKLYYMKYNPNLIKGIIELSNKIPLSDFFTKYNFILNKIKQYEENTNEQKLDIINEIFEKLNSKNINKNNLGNYYENIFDKVTNKILFYILYYYQNVRNEEYKHYKDLMIKFHTKKLIELKN